MALRQAATRSAIASQLPVCDGSDGPVSPDQYQGSEKSQDASVGEESHCWLCLGHLRHVRPTLRISCEAVPPSVWPAGAQGGTSACTTGAALSFVSCIRLFDGTVF
jgi:hypothetical protein